MPLLLLPALRLCLQPTWEDLVQLPSEAAALAESLPLLRVVLRVARAALLVAQGLLQLRLLAVLVARIRWMLWRAALLDLCLPTLQPLPPPLPCPGRASAAPCTSACA